MHGIIVSMTIYVRLVVYRLYGRHEVCKRYVLVRSFIPTMTLDIVSVIPMHARICAARSELKRISHFFGKKVNHNAETQRTVIRSTDTAPKDLTAIDESVVKDGDQKLKMRTGGNRSKSHGIEAISSVSKQGRH